MGLKSVLLSLSNSNVFAELTLADQNTNLKLLMLLTGQMGLMCCASSDVYLFVAFRSFFSSWFTFSSLSFASALSPATCNENQIWKLIGEALQNQSGTIGQ